MHAPPCIGHGGAARGDHAATRASSTTGPVPRKAEDAGAARQSQSVTAVLDNVAEAGGPDRPQLVTDSRVADLDEFSRPWRPRALGRLYRADDVVTDDDLADALVIEYRGAAAGELLTKMTGAAVRTGLHAATEAGMATVQVPTDIGIGPDLAPLVDGSGEITGAPAWLVAPVEGASNSHHSAATSCD
jgi:hypothetical protein